MFTEPDEFSEAQLDGIRVFEDRMYKHKYIRVNYTTYDIRRGRDAAQREDLAKALIAACAETLGLAAGTINVEFTQHDGDEMYHAAMGRLSRDWSAAEAG